VPIRERLMKGMKDDIDIHSRTRNSGKRIYKKGASTRAIWNNKVMWAQEERRQEQTRGDIGKAAGESKRKFQNLGLSKISLIYQSDRSVVGAGFDSSYFTMSRMQDTRK